MRIFMFFAMFFLIAGNAQAEMYRSVDSQGKVHYSDTPLANSDEVEELLVAPAPTPDASLPYETRRAQKNFPVTLYTAPDCGSPCSEAQAFLDKRGIPYSVHLLDTAEKAAAYSKETGGLQVPSLTIGKNRLIGFLATDWNKELDYAGYPKSAPYRPRTALPAK